MTEGYCWCLNWCDFGYGRHTAGVGCAAATGSAGTSGTSGTSGVGAAGVAGAAAAAAPPASLALRVRYVLRLLCLPWT